MSDHKDLDAAVRALELQLESSRAAATLRSEQEKARQLRESNRARLEAGLYIIFSVVIIVAMWLMVIMQFIPS